MQCVRACVVDIANPEKCPKKKSTRNKMLQKNAIKKGEKIEEELPKITEKYMRYIYIYAIYVYTHRSGKCVLHRGVWNAPTMQGGTGGGEECRRGAASLSVILASPSSSCLTLFQFFCAAHTRNVLQTGHVDTHTNTQRYTHTHTQRGRHTHTESSKELSPSHVSSRPDALSVLSFLSRYTIYNIFYI